MSHSSNRNPWMLIETLGMLIETIGMLIETLAMLIETLGVLIETLAMLMKPYSDREIEAIGNKRPI